MKHILPALLALSLPALSLPALAHEYEKDGLMVDHPMAFETPKTAKIGAGYLSVTNHGKEEDALIGVVADFPMVTIHRSMQEDGMNRMEKVERIAIPAGETVELAPGGYHVMFMGLDGDPFEAGEKIPATLVFEKAGEIAVDFNVEARGAGGAGGASHGGHDHHQMKE